MPQKRRDPAVAGRFGENLRRVRRREDLTQEELARRAGLHRTEIGRLENGERAPRIDTLIRLADSMVVPPGELLDGISWVPAPEAVGAFAFGSSSISPSPRPAIGGAGD
jgi:transcriptional regulator with XRE-family HTH domain